MTLRKTERTMLPKRLQLFYRYGRCYDRRVFTYRQSTALLCMLLISAPELMAHDLYILPRSFKVHRGEQLRVAFHNGDSFPQSEVAPKPERLRNAQVSSLRASRDVMNLHVEGLETLGDLVIPETGDLQLSVTTEPNLIALPPDKFLAYLKEEGLSEVIAEREKRSETTLPGRERYSKYAKALLRSDKVGDAYYKHLLGFPIEIVPLADPYSLHAGDKLPVVVLLRGKAAAGMQLEAARASEASNRTTIIGRTDSDGHIDIPLDQAGLWRLHSLHMERCPDVKVADWESLWASFTFEVR